VAADEPDPTNAVLRAIARRDINDAVVRVRITLPAEMEPHLREVDIRQSLAPAHYIAAVSRNVEGMRRTRLSADVTEGLQPLQAVRLYLESRGVEPQRREQILKRAEELVEQEAEGPDADGQI
jgi:exonuclease SbcD